MRLIFTITFTCILYCGFAQTNYDFKEVLSENIYVASTAAAYNPLASNKRDRVLREVTLPPGTVSYTFRITVTERSTPPNTNLITEVAKLGGLDATGLGVIAKLATASDGNQADVFVFNNWNDANKFAAKQEGWWGCKAYKQTTSSCRTENGCMDMVAFGFRNNNGATGLNIFFELVATIDPSKKNYSPEVREALYSTCLNNEQIKNATGQKTENFCSCWADKLVNDETFATSDNAVTREKISKEVGKICLQELNLGSKNEIAEAAFNEEIKEIEASRGKTGVISFCEEKIAAGTTDDFVYNCLGWNCLLTKQLTKALYYLKSAEEKYPLNLYLKGNYAHALLLTGKYSEAMEIYKAYLNENIAENISWKLAVTDDINKFKSLGIINEHFDEILNLVK